jgi:Mad1 and Cdc20-bound-Mad2 binding
VSIPTTPELTAQRADLSFLSPSTGSPFAQRARQRASTPQTDSTVSSSPTITPTADSKRPHSSKSRHSRKSGGRKKTKGVPDLVKNVRHRRRASGTWETPRSELLRSASDRVARKRSKTMGGKHSSPSRTRRRGDVPPLFLSMEPILITFKSVVPNSVTAHLFAHLFQHLLYSRHQIPSPFLQMQSRAARIAAARDAGTLKRHRRTALENKFLKFIGQVEDACIAVGELLASHVVHELVIIFATSIISPRECYRISVKYRFENGPCSAKVYQSAARRLIRSMISLSAELGSTTLKRMKVFVMAKVELSSVAVPPSFIPKQNFRLKTNRSINMFIGDVKTAAEYRERMYRAMLQEHKQTIQHSSKLRRSKTAPNLSNSHSSSLRKTASDAGSAHNNGDSKTPEEFSTNSSWHGGALPELPPIVKPANTGLFSSIGPVPTETDSDSTGATSESSVSSTVAPPTMWFQCRSIPQGLSDKVSSTML